MNNPYNIETKSIDINELPEGSISYVVVTILRFIDETLHKNYQIDGSDLRELDIKEISLNIGTNVLANLLSAGIKPNLPTKQYLISIDAFLKDIEFLVKEHFKVKFSLKADESIRN